MTINYNVLFNHFSWDSNIYALAIDIFERMESADEEELYECMDVSLIYTKDQWEMMMAYQTPQEANFDSAWDSFCSDLVSALYDGAIEEDEEEDE